MHDILRALGHELRTPLAGVLGFAEMLDEGHCGALTERQHAAVREIAASGSRLLALVEDLPDVVAILSGASPIALASVRVADALALAVDSERWRAEAGGVVLSVDPVPPDLQVQADDVRLRQMIAQLVRNAVLATPPGGTVRLRGARGLDGCVDLAVCDTGRGIAAADLERIFDPFARVDDGSPAPRTAAGLGLALVRALAGRHGGSVRVESQPGAGSTFTLSLPG